MRPLASIIGSIAVMVSLTGCITAPTVPASPEFAQAARTVEKPAADRARVYVFTGRTPLLAGGTAGPMSKHYLPADIYVNSVKVGTVNPDEALVFDVAPGQYTFTWLAYNGKLGWGESQRPGTVDLPGGAIVTISADKVANTYLVNEGVMGTLVDKDGNRLAPNVKIVRAAACPPTLCL